MYLAIERHIPLTIHWVSVSSCKGLRWTVVEVCIYNPEVINN